jgi:hypothetical protein
MKGRVFEEGTAAEGHLESDLSRGSYLVLFSSPDNTIRNVEFTTQATERRFKDYQPIALALLTIGTVLLVNGLGIYIR